MISRIIAFSLILVAVFCWIGLGDGIRAPKEIASVISFLAIVGVCLFNYPLKPFKNKYLLVFMGWCFFTTLISINIPLYFDKIILNMPSTIIAYKSLFYILLAVMGVVCISSTQIDLNKISKTINYIVIFSCIYGVIQIFGCDEFFRVGSADTGWIGQSIWSGVDPAEFGSLCHRIVATYGNPALFAIFLAMCFPFSLYRFKQEGKISVILSLLIFSVFLINRQCTTGIISFICGVMFYLFFTHRKIAIVFISLIIISAVLFVHKNPSFLDTGGRIGVLIESGKILYKKPLTGLGLGSFEHLIGGNPDTINKLKKQNWKEMHNEYGQCWFETGLIGLILLSLILLNTFKRFLKNVNKETVILASSVIVICVASMSYFVLRVGPLAYYSVVIFGLLENKIGEVI